MTLRDKNKEIKKQISEVDVLHYLAENPDVIKNNIDLFNEIFSINKNNGNVISFEDVRIKSLIKENTEIKKKLNENYTIVNSLLKGTSERPEVKIDWRIYTKDKQNPLIRDLIIEGLSLARTQKEEFSSILNSNDGDIMALFKTLEEFSKS